MTTQKPTPRLPTVQELTAQQLTYVFSLKDMDTPGTTTPTHSEDTAGSQMSTPHVQRFFLALDEKLEPPAGFSYVNLKDIRSSSDVSHANMLEVYTAYHLATWYATNRFCGHCGHRMKLDTVERALRCPSCNHVVYPRINPAVIVGITNGSKLVLTRYARNRGVSYDALVAGFTEIGETAEQTVRREVMEEVGLKVKNLRYYKSQPWGVAADLLLGFYCDVDGDPTITMDQEELSYARWVEAQDIEGQPDDLSLTNEMMMHFKACNGNV